MSPFRLPVLDLLTVHQVARRLTVSTRTIYRLLERGSFPPPIRYTRKLVRWRTADVERYLASLAEGAAHAPNDPVIV
jgi:excisionase family DNA binding protein